MARARTAAPRARTKRNARVLAPEWRTWIAENLMRGAPPAQLIAALREHGVPAREAATRVEEAATSPLLALAQRHARRGQQLDRLVQLLAAAARTAVHPAAVERRTTIP